MGKIAQNVCDHMRHTKDLNVPFYFLFMVNIDGPISDTHS